MSVHPRLTRGSIDDELLLQEQERFLAQQTAPSAKVKHIPKVPETPKPDRDVVTLDAPVAPILQAVFEREVRSVVPPAPKSVGFPQVFRRDAGPVRSSLSIFL
jgi:hypothetical protein